MCLRCRGSSYVSSKVTTMDWDSANKANFKLADKEKGLAEQLRNDAWRAVKATDRQARVRQAANTKRLGMYIHIYIYTNVASLLANSDRPTPTQLHRVGRCELASRCNRRVVPDVWDVFVLWISRFCDEHDVGLSVCLKHWSIVITQCNKKSKWAHDLPKLTWIVVFCEPELYGRVRCGKNVELCTSAAIISQT